MRGAAMAGIALRSSWRFSIGATLLWLVVLEPVALELQRSAVLGHRAYDVVGRAAGTSASTSSVTVHLCPDESDQVSEHLVGDDARIAPCAGRVQLHDSMEPLRPELRRGRERRFRPGTGLAGRGRRLGRWGWQLRLELFPRHIRTDDQRRELAVRRTGCSGPHAVHGSAPRPRRSHRRTRTSPRATTVGRSPHGWRSSGPPAPSISAQ